MIDSVSESAGAAADLKQARRRKNVSAADPIQLDRLPPHSPEAEQGVLGCVLLSPNECMGECMEKLKDGKEVFYDLRHQTIFETLVAMYDAREAIDVITLQQRLKDKQLLEQIGGIAYLAQLQDARAERGEFKLLPRHRPGKIPAAENDRHLHGRRRARV